MQDMKKKANAAAGFLKSLANPHRLIVLCALAQGEHSVSDLIDITGISQTSMSQHLSKLKDENLVAFRRDHRTLYYYIKDQNVLRIIGILYDIYCKK